MPLPVACAHGPRLPPRPHLPPPCRPRPARPARPAGRGAARGAVGGEVSPASSAGWAGAAGEGPPGGAAGAAGGSTSRDPSCPAALQQTAQAPHTRAPCRRMAWSPRTCAAFPPSVPCTCVSLGSTPCRRPSNRTIGATAAGGTDRPSTGPAAAAGRFGTSSQVLSAGTVAGSVVAVTPRGRVGGPSGPPVPSPAHQVAVGASRHVRSTGGPAPGASGPSLVAMRAAAPRAGTVPAGVHQACDGVRATTDPPPAWYSPVRTPSVAPAKRSATTARKGPPSATARRTRSRTSWGVVRSAGSAVPRGTCCVGGNGAPASGEDTRASAHRLVPATIPWATDRGNRQLAAAAQVVAADLGRRRPPRPVTRVIAHQHPGGSGRGRRGRPHPVHPTRRHRRCVPGGRRPQPWPGPGGGSLPANAGRGVHHRGAGLVALGGEQPPGQLLAAGVPLVDRAEHVVAVLGLRLPGTRRRRGGLALRHHPTSSAPSTPT